MNLKQLLWPVIGAIALAAGVYAGNLRLQTGSNDSSNGTGAQAAALPRWSAFAFNDAAGQPYELKQLEGRTVVINFWATWCPPCVEEMPDLERLYPALRANKIEMIGIGIDSPSNVREFLQKRSFSYPLLVAGAQGADLARLLGNPAGSLPYTVVLDPDGSVRWSKLGRVTPEELTRATGLRQP